MGGVGEFARRQAISVDPTRPRCGKLDCEDAAVVSGFCDPHYWEARRESAAPCQDSECDEKSDVKGYCRPHYKKMRQKGKLNLGTLYVIEASTGVIMVGRTSRGLARIQEHRRSAITWGADIVQWWMSPDFDRVQQAERALLDQLADTPGVVRNPVAAEVFSGALTFDWVVSLVEKLHAEQ